MHWVFNTFLFNNSLNIHLAMAGLAEEHRAHHPPPSFAPRLHCVYMKKLDNNNPLLLDNSVLEGINSCNCIDK